MKISLLILSAPYSNPGLQTALRFATAAIDAGHCIHQVFFYYDGVYAANRLITTPQGEFDTVNAWITLAEKHQIGLIACIASAMRRGVINQQEAQRFNQPVANLHPAFELAGLGELLAMQKNSDRLVTFA